MTVAGSRTLAPLDAVVLAVLLAHWRGRQLLVGRCAERPRGAAAREAWLFRLGTLVAAAAVTTPLAALGAKELFASALVEFALAWIAAPLIVLGAPWQALGIAAATALGSRRGPGGNRRARAASADGAPPHTPLPGQPVLGVACLLLTYWLWHIPALLDPTAGSEALRAVENLTYLASGCLFWSELVSSYPYVPRWSQLRRNALVVAAFAGYWGLAATIVYAPRSWYPAFAAVAKPLIAPTVSQELSGAIMWALPSIPLGVVVFWCFAGWLEHEEEDERRLAELSATVRSRRAGAGGP